MVAKLEPASWKLVTPLGERLLRGEVEPVCDAPFHGRLRFGPRSSSRLRGAEQPLSRFSQEPGWLAVGTLHDLAARRVRRASRDVRQLHRALVDESGVAARVCQDHRIVRRYLRQRVVHRVAFDGAGRRCVPFLLVPAAPADPRVVSLYRAWPPRHHSHDLVPALHLHQVENQSWRRPSPM